MAANILNFKRLGYSRNITVNIRCYYATMAVLAAWIGTGLTIAALTGHFYLVFKIGTEVIYAVMVGNAIAILMQSRLVDDPVKRHNGVGFGVMLLVVPCLAGIGSAIPWIATGF